MIFHSTSRKVFILTALGVQPISNNSTDLPLNIIGENNITDHPTNQIFISLVQNNSLPKDAKNTSIFIYYTGLLTTAETVQSCDPTKFKLSNTSINITECYRLRQRLQLVLNTTEVPNGTKLNYSGNNSTIPNTTSFTGLDVRYNYTFNKSEWKFVNDSFFYYNQLRTDCDRLPTKMIREMQYGAMLRSLDSRVNRYVSHNSPYFGGFNAHILLIYHGGGGENLTIADNSWYQMQQWYFSTPHYDNMMSDAQNFGMGFWRLEPGVNDGHIINYLIVGNGSKHIPNVPVTGPVIINFTEPQKMNDGVCLFDLIDSEDKKDQNDNYWGIRKFKMDENGLMMIYGIPRGKYHLDCGPERSITVRISGQTFKRYMIIKPYGGNQHEFNTSEFNQSLFATVKGQKMRFQGGQGTGEMSTAQKACKEKGYKNCGTYDRHPDLLYDKSAPMTTDGFTEAIVNKVESVVRATNVGVTSGVVAVQAIVAGAVVAGIVMGTMVAIGDGAAGGGGAAGAVTTFVKPG